MVFIIIGSILLLLIIVYLVLSYIVFKKAFKPGTDPGLEEVDLTKTHYAPYIDILYEKIRYMKSLEFEEVCIENKGTKLYGRFYNRGSDKTILMVHGFRAIPFSNFSYSASYFLEHGYNVLLISQRAHEKSEGKYITLGYLESTDVNEWVKYLEEKRGLNRITIYGTSMGAATVLVSQGRMEQKAVRCIVFDCGYRSAKESILMAMKSLKIPTFFIYGMNLFALLLGHFSIFKMSPEKLVSFVNTPIVFIHSKKDDFIPYQDSKYLYEHKDKGDKLLMLVEEGGHTTAFMASTDKTKEKMFNFIEEKMNNE